MTSSLQNSFCLCLTELIVGTRRVICWGWAKESCSPSLPFFAKCGWFDSMDCNISESASESGYWKARTPSINFWCFEGWCCFKDDRIACQLLAFQHLERSRGQSSCLCTSDWVTSNLGKGALHTPKEQPSTGRFSVCGQLLQCETHKLPSNAPQALVMAEQLRESPPETARNLIPGKWEADLGQGCDTNKDSHYRCTYRHRSQMAPSRKAHQDGTRHQERIGKRRRTLQWALPAHPDPIQLHPKYYIFSASPWLQNLVISPILLLWHQCPPQELREAALAHVLGWKEK